MIRIGYKISLALKSQTSSISPRRTTLMDGAYRRTWIKTVYGCLTTYWMYDVGFADAEVSRALHAWCASASVSRLTSHLQPRNRDETCLPSRTHKCKHVRRYEPGTRTGYTTNTVVMDTWILRLWGSGDACNLRGQPRYVSSSYYHFRVINSFILSARMAFFSFLAHTQPIQLATEIVRRYGFS